MRPLPGLHPDVYEHLRAIANRIHAERGHGQLTLQPTDLLHEAWIKLERSTTVVESRRHFMAVAARAMRQILVDRGRARATQKRDRGDQVVLAGEPEAPGSVLDLLDVDTALTELASVDEEACTVAELRVFAGLQPDEIAEVVGLSERTVKRRWRFGKAFLAARLAATT